jgi:hypothetical protein
MTVTLITKIIAFSAEQVHLVDYIYHGANKPLVSECHLVVIDDPVGRAKGWHDYRAERYRVAMCHHM